MTAGTALAFVFGGISIIAICVGISFIRKLLDLRSNELARAESICVKHGKIAMDPNSMPSFLMKAGFIVLSQPQYAVLVTAIASKADPAGAAERILRENGYTIE